MELSSNEDDDGDENQDESSDEESDDEVGDPSKDPGEGCSKEVPHDYLQPFVHGWRREVVYRYFNIFNYFFLLNFLNFSFVFNCRNKTKNTASQCDIYYIPPQDGRYRTREAKRKRRSKVDQERYFQDFPDDYLSMKHFNYVRKPLGLENAAYEIIRKSKLRENDNADEDASDREKENHKKSMKEVEESAGLLESAGEDDEELVLINGFDVDMPISLQVQNYAPETFKM